MTTYRGTPAASLSRGRKFYAIRYSAMASLIHRKRIARCDVLRSQNDRRGIAESSQCQRQHQRQNSYTYGRLFIIRHLGDASRRERMMALRAGEIPC